MCVYTKCESKIVQTPLKFPQNIAIKGNQCIYMNWQNDIKMFLALYDQPVLGGNAKITTNFTIKYLHIVIIINMINDTSTI